jgi:hypothetical protein
VQQTVRRLLQHIEELTHAAARLQQDTVPKHSRRPRTAPPHTAMQGLCLFHLP